MDGICLLKEEETEIKEEITKVKEELDHLWTDDYNESKELLELVPAVEDSHVNNHSTLPCDSWDKSSDQRSDSILPDLPVKSESHQNDITVNISKDLSNWAKLPKEGCSEWILNQTKEDVKEEVEQHGISETKSKSPTSHSVTNQETVYKRDHCKTVKEPRIPSSCSTPMDTNQTPHNMQQHENAAVDKESNEINYKNTSTTHQQHSSIKLRSESREAAKNHLKTARNLNLTNVDIDACSSIRKAIDKMSVNGNGCKEYLVNTQRKSNTKFSCGLCKKQFDREYSLNIHQKSKCGTVKPFQCKLCKKQFLWKISLNEHEKLICGPSKYLRCNGCNKPFKCKELLINHQKSECGTIFSCDMCNKLFNFKISLTNHQKSKCGTVKPFQCKLCKKQFLWKISLNQHEKLICGPSKYLRCNGCNKPFKCKELLINHQKSECSTIFSCDVCNKLFNLKISLTNHQKSKCGTVKPFQCKLCKKQFLWKISLNEHEKLILALQNI